MRPQQRLVTVAVLGGQDGEQAHRAGIAAQLGCKPEQAPCFERIAAAMTGHAIREHGLPGSPGRLRQPRRLGGFYRLAR
ncbi:hypothetical protein [Lichenicoccus sp.]|uniref:hypothetical protein n=1 Tax=Lichenicoccus sp. TaxID=2781899 RepID=UPI003D11BADE